MNISSIALAAPCVLLLAASCSASRTPENGERAAHEVAIPTREPAPAEPALTEPETSDPVPTERAATPMRAYWSHSPNTDPAASPLTIELTVTRVESFAAPATVNVRAPSDVQITSGPSEFEIPAGETETRIAWTLEFDELPAEDFVVVVNVAEDGFGFHAEPTYRFGRPEPTAPPLPRLGRDLEHNGIRLGDPIDLGAAPQAQ